MNKLYRSKNNRWIAGICGGLGKFFNIDPTIVRVIWIIGTLFSMGFGIILYLIIWAVIPER